MATATANPTQAILDRLDRMESNYKGVVEGVKKQETAIDGLLKLVAAPASKAGVSPQEYLQSIAQKNDHVIVDSTGEALSNRQARRGIRNKNFIGNVQREDRQRGSFGEWLTAFKDFHDHERLSHDDRMKANSILRAYGQQQSGYQTQEIPGHNGKTLVDVVRKTALAESSAITGGYTVPPMFEETLFELAIENVIVQPRARKYPLTARTLQIPSLDQTNTSFTATAGQSNLLAGVQATWTAEAATRTESEPLFRQTVLTAWELSFYALASNTLLADNAVGLDALLTQLFGYAIGWYTDYAYLQGSGVGQPLGILNAPATIKQSRLVASHFTFTDAALMIAQMYWMLRGGRSLAWVIHQSVIGDLLRMNDQSAASTYATTLAPGRSLFVSINEGAQEPLAESAGVQSIGYLFGYPVLISEKLPGLGTAGDVCLIDFDKYALGQRMDMEIMVSPHVKFLNNQMAWRIVWRGDGQPLLNNAITLADGTKKASPYIILN